MKTALICIALCCLALSAQAGGFGLPETDLQLTYMHSLNSGENQTCLTVSFEITRVASMPLNLDVLFAPDFEDFGNWGFGLSTELKGISSNLKLGVGLMDGLSDPVVYIGFSL